MSIKLSRLMNIGVVVSDSEEAYRLLHNLFGAIKIQEDLADLLYGNSAKIIHVGIGDLVLQFIEPLAKEGIWFDHLQAKGPGVHHLTFNVANIKDAVKMMEKEVDPLSTVEIDWDRLIPSDQVNEKANKLYIMDTMNLIGFHLALSENPMKNEVDTSKTKYPTGFDNLIGDASTMLHIELTNSDNEKTYEFLHRLFRTEIVEKEFSDILNSDFMRIIHVNLSNVVLQYCQPVAKQGTWYELLQKNGPYVHNLNWCVEDIRKTVELFKEERVPQIFEARLPDSDPDSPPFYMMNTLNKLGFHLEHGQAPTTEEGFEFIKNMLFIDFKK